MTYQIRDWANNLMEDGKEFESFEEAWDYILDEMTKRFELNEEEYFVQEKGEVK